MNDRALQSIKASIERFGSAEVSADRLAALAGARALDPSGWDAIEAWLADHGLIVISRPDERQGRKAQASIMAAQKS